MRWGAAWSSRNRSGAYTQILSTGHTAANLRSLVGKNLQKSLHSLSLGARKAVYNSSGTLILLAISDHLGSIRLGSTSSRTVSFDVSLCPVRAKRMRLPALTDPALYGPTPGLQFSGLYDFSCARVQFSQGRWALLPDPIRHRPQRILRIRKH